jgi:hypothetical protein
LGDDDFLQAIRVGFVICVDAAARFLHSSREAR